MSYEIAPAHEMKVVWVESVNPAGPKLSKTMKAPAGGSWFPIYESGYLRLIQAPANAR